MSANLKLDSAAQARAALTASYEGLVAGSKVAVGDDGRILLMAAAAVDLAVEQLTPPTPDAPSALGSCREAVMLLGKTRAYASGGNIARTLDVGRQKLDEAVALLKKATA